VLFGHLRPLPEASILHGALLAEGRAAGQHVLWKVFEAMVIERGRQLWEKMLSVMMRDF